MGTQEEKRAWEGSRGRVEVHASHLQVQQAALNNFGGRFLGPSELADLTDAHHAAQHAAAQAAAQQAAAQQQAVAAQVGPRRGMEISVIWMLCGADTAVGPVKSFQIVGCLTQEGLAVDGDVLGCWI